MKIENLTVGVVKNYKELCRLLCVEEKSGGNNRKLQMQEFSRYFDYEKQGQKIIIKEIYDMPKEKIETRGGRNNNTPYIQYIEKLVLDLLMQSIYKGQVFLPKNRLFKELKMINGNYAFCKNRILKLSKFICVEEETIEEWYLSTDKTLKGNLERALNNLKDQSLILWSSEITVCKMHIVGNENNTYDVTKKVYLDEFDEEQPEYKVNVNFAFSHRQATEDEQKTIMYTEREVMKSLGFSSKQDIVRCGKWNDFKDTVNSILLDKLNIDYYYDSYKILFNGEHICEKYEELLYLLLSKDDREKHQQELNKAIVERLESNVVKKQNRASQESECWFGEISDTKIIRRTNPNYIEDNRTLINKLIDVKSEDIKKKVKRTKLN